MNLSITEQIFYAIIILGMFALPLLSSSTKFEEKKHKKEHKP
jgi:uncharacterized membrane protein YuzA (DUF378 family)